jgi:micrococcal nuclease
MVKRFLVLALLCRVVGVSDGDTLTARCQNQTVKVRLAHIDAPERKQAFGQRAKQRLSELVFGKEIELRGETKDRYGRTVAEVLTDVNVNQEMVRSGLAWHYSRYSKSQKYADLQTEAREKKLGLWSQEFMPPWEFRRLNKSLKSRR